MNAITSTETKALELLGQGVSQEQVAAALGVTPAAISQLMAQEQFAAQVSELRFKNLQKHSARDTELDALEDAAIKKVKETLPLVMQPMQAAKILQIVNGAKRRSTSAPEHLTNVREVVNLTLPVSVLTQFNLTTTSDNRVVEAGSQQLVTMQSHLLKNLLPAPGDKNGGPELQRIEDGRSSKQKAAIDFDL